MRFMRPLLVTCTVFWATAALALEYPIGTPKSLAGMEVAAVYLQAVEMEPEGHMRKATESDIHLEADIHALANNPNGFAFATHSCLAGGNVASGTSGPPSDLKRPPRRIGVHFTLAPVRLASASTWLAPR